MILGKSFNLSMPHFSIYKMGIMMVNWASQVALVVKNLPINAEVRHTSLIPGLGRFLEGGYDNPFQYSCLGNPTDRGVWQATAHGAAKEWDTT